MKKIVALVIGIILSIIFALGFVEEDTSKVNNNSEGIVYSVPEITTDLEKVTEVERSKQDILCAISRGLLAKDSKGNIIPVLAESYKQSEDGIEYTFNLRNDIYWSDGSKITAQDYRDFFKELIKSEDESNIQEILNIYGAIDFKKGLGTFEKGVAITTEDNILKIRLNKKDDNFLNELTKIQYRLRKSLVLWKDTKGFYKDLIYSGEYQITEFNEASIVLEANPTIKDIGIDKIVAIKDENKEVAAASFEFGKRDIVINPPENQLNKLNQQKKLITAPSNSAFYLAINDQIEDLQLATRSGIYKSICEALSDYEQEFSSELEVSEGSYFREDKEDLAKLQSRKVSVNENQEVTYPKELTIYFEENSINNTVCEYITNWFNKNKNIKLQFLSLKQDKMKEVISNKKYDMLILKSQNDRENRQKLFEYFKEVLNADEINTFEEEKLNNEKNYSKLEDKLFSSYQILPLAFLNDNICISNKIDNIGIDYNGNLDFSKVNN
jgi:peptide/nickel transport system substrate-binding protein